MMPHKLPPEILEALSAHLPLGELLEFGASCKLLRGVAMKTADSLIASELEGVHLHPTSMETSPQSKQHRIFLKAALRPSSLVFGYKADWPDATTAFPFALDSRGPLFLEFRLSAARAPNGTPKIGLVDAEAPWTGAGDLSRGQGGDLFAVSFGPACGGVCATAAVVRGPDGYDVPRPPGAAAGREYYTAALKWEQLGDCSRRWTPPIHAGLFLEDGSLTFYRMRGRVKVKGAWHSSGVVCRDLPRHVLPCAFMHSFIGYAQVDFVRLWNSPPDVCSGCDCAGHGLMTGWRRVIC